MSFSYMVRKDLLIECNVYDNNNPRKVIDTLLPGTIVYVLGNVVKNKNKKDQDQEENNNENENENENKGMDDDDDDFVYIEEKDHHIKGIIAALYLQPCCFPSYVQFASHLPSEACIRLRQEPSHHAKEVEQIQVSKFIFITVNEIRKEWYRVTYHYDENAQSWNDDDNHGDDDDDHSNSNSNKKKKNNNNNSHTKMKKKKNVHKSQLKIEGWMMSRMGDEKPLLIPMIPRCYQVNTALPEGCYIRVRCAPEKDAEEVAVVMKGMIFQGFHKWDNWIRVQINSEDDQHNINGSHDEEDNDHDDERREKNNNHNNGFFVGWCMAESFDRKTILLTEMSVQEYSFAHDLPDGCLLRVRKYPYDSSTSIGIVNKYKTIQGIDVKENWLRVCFEHFSSAWMMISTSGDGRVLLVKKTTDNNNNNNTKDNANEETTNVVSESQITVDVVTPAIEQKEKEEEEEEKGTTVITKPVTTGEEVQVQEKEKEKSSSNKRSIFNDTTPTTVKSKGEEEEEAAEELALDKITEWPCFFKAKTGPLKVRSEPSSWGDERGILLKGQLVKAIGVEEKWLKIIFGGKFDCWILAENSRNKILYRLKTSSDVAESWYASEKSRMDEAEGIVDKSITTADMMDENNTSSSASSGLLPATTTTTTPNKNKMNTTIIDDSAKYLVEENDLMINKNEVDASPFKVDGSGLENQNIGIMLTDKSWKTRCWAYDALRKMFDQETNCNAPLFKEYSSFLPQMLCDTNLSALDGALKAVDSYVKKGNIASASEELILGMTIKLIEKCLSGRPLMEEKSVHLLFDIVKTSEGNRDIVIVNLVNGLINSNLKVIAGCYKVCKLIINELSLYSFQKCMKVLHDNVAKGFAAPKPDIRNAAVEFATLVYLAEGDTFWTYVRKEKLELRHRSIVEKAFKEGRANHIKLLNATSVSDYSNEKKGLPSESPSSSPNKISTKKVLMDADEVLSKLVSATKWTEKSDSLELFASWLKNTDYIYFKTPTIQNVTKASMLTLALKDSNPRIGMKSIEIILDITDNIDSKTMRDVAAEIFLFVLYKFKHDQKPVISVAEDLLSLWYTNEIVTLDTIFDAIVVIAKSGSKEVTSAVKLGMLATLITFFRDKLRMSQDFRDKLLVSIRRENTLFSAYAGILVDISATDRKEEVRELAVQAIACLVVKLKENQFHLELDSIMPMIQKCPMFESIDIYMHQLEKTGLLSKAAATRIRSPVSRLRVDTSGSPNKVEANIDLTGLSSEGIELIEFLDDEDWKSRCWAYQALKKFFSEEFDEDAIIFVRFAEFMPKIVLDQNPSCRETALDVLTVYIEKANLDNAPIIEILSGLMNGGMSTERPYLVDKSKSLIVSIIEKQDPFHRKSAIESLLDNTLNKNYAIAGGCLDIVKNMFSSSFDNGLSYFEGFSKKLHETIYACASSASMDVKVIGVGLAAQLLMHEGESFWSYFDAKKISSRTNIQIENAVHELTEDVRKGVKSTNSPKLSMTRISYSPKGSPKGSPKTRSPNLVQQKDSESIEIDPISDLASSLMVGLALSKWTERIEKLDFFFSKAKDIGYTEVFSGKNGQRMVELIGAAINNSHVQVVIHTFELLTQFSKEMKVVELKPIVGYLLPYIFNRYGETHKAIWASVDTLFESWYDGGVLTLEDVYESIVDLNSKSGKKITTTTKKKESLDEKEKEQKDKEKQRNIRMKTISLLKNWFNKTNDIQAIRARIIFVGYAELFVSLMNECQQNDEKDLLYWAFATLAAMMNRCGDSREYIAVMKIIERIDGKDNIMNYYKMCDYETKVRDDTGIVGRLPSPMASPRKNGIVEEKYSFKQISPHSSSNNRKNMPRSPRISPVPSPSTKQAVQKSSVDEMYDFFNDDDGDDDDILFDTDDAKKSSSSSAYEKVLHNDVDNLYKMCLTDNQDNFWLHSQSPKGRNKRRETDEFNDTLLPVTEDDFKVMYSNMSEMSISSSDPISAAQSMQSSQNLMDDSNDQDYASLRTFLEEVHLSKYFSKLYEQDINLDVLLDLSDHDLEGLGLPLGARKRILNRGLRNDPSTNKVSVIETTKTTPILSTSTSGSITAPVVESKVSSDPKFSNPAPTYTKQTVKSSISPSPSSPSKVSFNNSSPAPIETPSTVEANNGLPVVPVTEENDETPQAINRPKSISKLPRPSEYKSRLPRPKTTIVKKSLNSTRSSET